MNSVSVTNEEREKTIRQTLAISDIQSMLIANLVTAEKSRGAVISLC